MTLFNGTPYHLPRSSVEDGVIMEGAVGVQSSVCDLIKFSQNFMEAADDQLSRNVISTEDLSLKQLPTLLQGHINLSPTSSKRGHTLSDGFAQCFQALWAPSDSIQCM